MDTSIHIRRCHVCGKVNECHNHQVGRCDFCGKIMAPFYYFDDAQIEPLADNQVRPEYHGQQFKPLYGLTAYW